MAVNPYLHVQQPAIQTVGIRMTSLTYMYKNKDKFDYAWAADKPEKCCKVAKGPPSEIDISIERLLSKFGGLAS